MSDVSNPSDRQLRRNVAVAVFSAVMIGTAFGIAIFGIVDAVRDETVARHGAHAKVDDDRPPAPGVNPDSL